MSISDYVTGMDVARCDNNTLRTGVSETPQPNCLHRDGKSNRMSHRVGGYNTVTAKSQVAMHRGHVTECPFFVRIRTLRPTDYSGRKWARGPGSVTPSGVILRISSAIS